MSTRTNQTQQFRPIIRLMATLSITILLSANATADKPLTDSVDFKRGIRVLLGDRTAAQTAIELAGSTELTIYVQSSNREEANAARDLAHEAGYLGTRITVDWSASPEIHLADLLADAVIVTDADEPLSDDVRREALRVLKPRGKLIVGDEITVKPVPPGTGDWTHPYHSPSNNPQANDRIARAPYLTRFLAAPYYGPMPEVTLSAGGRLFKAFGHIAFKRREWPLLGKLLCLDGYNGTLLWERELSPGFMIHRNTLIATEDVLYLGDNLSCKLIDTATGELRDEIVVPEEIADGPCWKWMAIENGILYALVGEREQSDEVLKGRRKKSGWPWSGMGKAYGNKEYPWGFGRTVLAINLENRKILWTHREEEKLDSRAMALAGGKLFLYSDQKFLAALDTQSGSEHWRTTAPEVLDAIGPHGKAQNPKLGYSSTVYTKASGDALYFAGPQRSKLLAVSAANGKLLWEHPEGNYQLVLRDEGLFAMGRTVTSRKLDPLTGEVLAELECFRGNCTRATGTADSIFTRGYRHTGTMRYDVAGEQPRRIPAMRPACQDGVVVANGLLYWGPWMCDCNHSLVGVVSLGSAGDFEFERQGSDADRLQVAANPAQVQAELTVTEADWPTYRKNNRRTAHTTVSVPRNVEMKWQSQPEQENEPTAPVAVGDRVYWGGADGTIRAIDSKSGTIEWVAYTGGAIRYPPTVWNSRVYAGSADGWVYCLNGSTGEELWRFQAAPKNQRIPVYGRLSSRWPVASGVLVDDGVVYAAAGIASHDGTHVYALDALTGKLRWQNNTSGNLMGEGVVSGISVQGHFLLDGEKLYMAGGNVVSPAIYDKNTGSCLNTLDNEWQRAPRGSELFLAAGKVRVVDTTLYAPRGYIPSRYHAKYLVEASSGDVLIQGTETAMMRVALGDEEAEKPRLVWKKTGFVETSAVVLTENAVVVAGREKGATKTAEPTSVLLAIDPETGESIWRKPLPAPPALWGLAIDRNGRILVTLLDGRLLCFAQ